MKNILIIDDNEEIRIAIYELLEDFGYKPYCSDNGFDAINLIKSLNNDFFDIFIVDYKMPKLNGKDFAIELKQINPNAKIIVISAHLEELERIFNEIEIQGFFKKPFKNHALISCIENVFNQAEHKYLS